MNEQREHCDLCDWTGPWHPQDAAGELLCVLDAMGHLSTTDDVHTAYYRSTFASEERLFFESGAMTQFIMGEISKPDGVLRAEAMIAGIARR